MDVRQKCRMLIKIMCIHNMKKIEIMYTLSDHTMCAQPLYTVLGLQCVEHTLTCSEKATSDLVLQLIS